MFALYTSIAAVSLSHPLIYI